MIKKSVTKWENEILMTLCSIIIIAVCTFNLNKLYGPIIVADEVGFWGAGYLFNGINWNGVMGYSPYYGWGYGLLLAILCKLPLDTIVMFRCAIVLNALLLVLCFFLAFRISDYVFPNIPKKIRIGICCAITLYSGYVYYSQTTYCETLVLFLFWLIIFLLMKILETRSYLYIILLSIATAYLYAVHQRTIIILIAVCMIMFFYFLSKKIDILKICMFLILCCSLLGVVTGVKSCVEDTLYSTSIVLDAYDTSGQMDKVSMLLSLDGIKRFIGSLIGKVLYVGTSTFLLFYIGIYAGVQKLVIRCIQRQKMNKYEMSFIIFVFVSFVGEILVSAISMMTFGRTDHIIYGRYAEFIFGAVMLYALCALYNKAKRIRIILVSVLTHVICYSITYAYIVNKGLTKSGAYAIPGIFGIYAVDGMDEKFRYTYYTATIALLIFLLLSLGFVMKKYYASFIVIAVMWVLIGINSANTSLYNEQQEREVHYYEFAEQVDDIIGEDDVYYIINDTEYVSWLKFKLKFFLPETNMIAVESADYEKVKKGSYIILYTPVEYYDYITKSVGEVVYKSEYFTLAKKK